MDNSHERPKKVSEDKQYINLLQFIAIDVVFFIVISAAVYRLGFPWYVVWIIGSIAAAVISLVFCGICICLIDTQAKLKLGCWVARAKAMNSPSRCKPRSKPIH